MADHVASHYHQGSLQYGVRALLFLLQMTCYVSAQGVQQGGGVGLCTSPQATSNRIFIHDVPESTPVGAVLIHLNVLGTDSQVRLRVLRPDPHIRFDPASRNLTLQKELDRESMASVQLELGCVILATDQEIKIPVNILILDVNDNPPVFKKNEYFANISELTPVDTTVIRDIAATDKDIDNWYITYEIVPGPFSDYFSIPSQAQGEVVLQKSLDYEKLKTMTFKVKAKDNHADNRQQESLTTVTVHIFDGDDQNPAFVDAPYTAVIEEALPKGSEVPVVPPIMALDQDIGINASIIYSLTPTWASGSQDHFTIDPATGRVTLTDNTGIRRGQSFFMLLKATQADNEDRFTTTSLTVTVAPANENPPHFSQREYVTQVVENTPIGSVVLTLQASDNDEVSGFVQQPPGGTTSIVVVSEGANLVYSFGTGPISPDFELDQRGGVLRTQRLLDYERQSQYRLNIRVSDGSFSDETIVVVNVVNVNDNPPVFRDPLYVFTKEFTEGATVGRLKAIDADPMTRITYSFKENVTLFSISEEGDIIIKGTKEQFRQNQYRLFVVAKDDGSPPLEGSTVVVVTFSPEVAAVAAVAPTGGQEMNLVLVSVLGVLCGCLLVVVIVLAVYIYKSRLKARKPKSDFVRSAAQEEDTRRLQSALFHINWTSSQHYRSHFSLPSDRVSSIRSDAKGNAKRQSFESRLNMNRDLASRTYLDDPDGLSFKPTKAHHLAMYNDIAVDPDATAPQDSPFVADDNLSHYTANSSNPGYRYDSQDINDNMNKHYSSGSSIDLNKRMNAVNEIEYDTAVTPIDHFGSSASGAPTGDAHLPAPPSANSSFQSIPGSMSTFRAGGSTQKLMTPRGTPKGSMNKKPQVSFVEDHEVNVYHPQHAIDPTIANMAGAPVDEERPGITIYY